MSDSRFRRDLVLFTSEVAFLLHAPYWLDPTSKVELGLLVARTALNAAAFLFTGWLWFGSVALWAVSLLRWKFSDANLLDSGLKYGLANISLVNFSIDIPGLLLKHRIWTTWVVIAINLFAGIVFVFCAFAEEPIQKAWGCYPPGSTAYDLVYGVCPEFKSDDGLPTPVCDQRGVFCYQTHPKPFNTTVAITGQVVAAGAAIYVLSIKNKIMRL